MKSSDAAPGRPGSLELEHAALLRQLRATQESLDLASREHARLRRELLELQAESRRLTAQYASVEQQNGTLATLYVASHRLMGTLSREEILLTLKDLVATLVGCEEMAVYETAADGRTLERSASYEAPHAPERVRPGVGLLGRTALRGETLVVSESDRERAAPGEQHLSACIPLRLEGQVTGLVALFRLLPQKPALEDADLELFDLFSTHAGAALFCSRFRAQVPAAHA